MQNKKILLLTTGGTIAGVGGDASKGSQYQAGVLQGEKLLEALPKMEVRLELREFYNLDSIEMDLDKWREIALFIQDHYEEYEGFVITHGTDTLEEASFFFSLVCAAKKPIVLVGAMRSANALGSDGSKNLSNAIALATSEAKGVMVLMNDRIFDPWKITKIHTHNLDSFGSQNGGALGYVLDMEVFFFESLQSPKVHFCLQDFSEFAEVGILPIYAGVKQEEIPSWVQGLVVMGCGAGNIPQRVIQALEVLSHQGKQVVVSTRVWSGIVCHSQFIPSFTLNPFKARILLSLCLSAKVNAKEVFESLRA